MAMTMAENIRDKALELGYLGCGIIDIEELAGFDEKLAERVARFPESEPTFRNYKRSLPNLRKKYPWARSVIVTVRRYGKYKLPPQFHNRVAKFYLADARIDPAAVGYQASRALDSYIRELGLQVASDPKFGNAPYRWAAWKAGLGLIRKNNFFYTRHGSWVDIETWLVDKEMVLKETCDLPPCPEGCNLCVKSCPTASLAEPYMTNRESCISALTTWTGRDMPREPYRREIGGWVYGCDACQDVCPFNRGAWTEDEDFPGLDRIAEAFSLESVVSMDYETLRKTFADKFFYVAPEDGWKWKVNALNAMANESVDAYRETIYGALRDPDPRVREMAGFVLSGG